MSISEFLDMGGYAVYVWSSYGITLIVLVANVIGPLRLRRKLLADIARATRRARRKS
ncbi:MAG: heme exporter protein CcmD [Gammaproteobacteria bacterium]|nr:MAG: heme exporter protein CcmD [Gammaproteobacteria bacterium]